MTRIKMNAARRLPLLALLPLAVQTALAQDAEQAKALGEVVVSAAGFEQEIEKAPASISVITRENLEARRINTLAEALSEVEGVDVDGTSDKTGGLSISLRGMPSDYTLILIDGRRQNSAGNVTPNNFGGTASGFMPPVAAIERIEVIRGPMSTLYGSDAMGGVVNIITRKVAKKWNGSVSSSATLQEDSNRGNFYDGQFYLSGPIKADTFGLALRGDYRRRQKSELEATGEGAGEARVSSFGRNPVESNIHTLGARATFTPSREHEIYADLETTRQRYNNQGGAMGRLGKGGYADTLRFNRSQAVLAWNGDFNFGRLESSITRNETETIGRLIPLNIPGKTALSPRELKAENTIFDAKLLTLLGENHFLTVGGQYWKAEMVDGVASDGFKFDQWALYGEDEWTLPYDITLTLGLRHDHHDKFGGQTSPRVYGVWQATPDWVVKGGVSRGFKTPRLDQLANGIVGFGGQGTIPLLGSPGLTPETSTSYEIGTVWDNKQGLKLAATLFYNKFQDKIARGDGLPNCSWKDEPNRPGCVDFGNWPRVDFYGQSVNIDEATTKGLELSGRIPLMGERLYATANYTWTDSRQDSGKNAGEPLFNTPKHMLNVKLNWRIDEQWETWLQAQYRSKRYRSSGWYPEAREQLGDYHSTTVLNLGATWKVNKNLRINGAVYNLLDKDFLRYGAYTRRGKVAYTPLYSNTLEGRRYWISMTYDF